MQKFCGIVFDGTCIRFQTFDSFQPLNIPPFFIRKLNDSNCSIPSLLLRPSYRHLEQNLVRKPSVKYNQALESNNRSKLKVTFSVETHVKQDVEYKIY